jgi:hypothetical protein
MRLLYEVASDASSSRNGSSLRDASSSRVETVDDLVTDTVESLVDDLSVPVEALVDEDLVARRVTEILALHR